MLASAANMSSAVQTPATPTTLSSTQASAHSAAIDLTQDDDESTSIHASGAGQHQTKRPRIATTPSETARSHPGQQPTYFRPGAPVYVQQPQWASRPAPPGFDATAANAGHLPNFYPAPGAPTPPFYAGPVTPTNFYPGNGRYAAAPVVQQPYTPTTPGGFHPGVAYPPLAPPGRVIDLTVPSPPPGTATVPSQSKDNRKDVVCIGQLTVTALVLYPIPYICAPPGQQMNPNFAYQEDYVPVRLRYDAAGKKRARSAEETIHIMAPIYKGANGEQSGGEDFGVVEQRAATVIGPMMQKVLIRLEALVKRGQQPNVSSVAFLGHDEFGIYRLCNWFRYLSSLYGS